MTATTPPTPPREPAGPVPHGANRAFAPLPAPVLATPPDCACKGLAPQMREHTARHCSTLTTAELNALTAALWPDCAP